MNLVPGVYVFIAHSGEVLYYGRSVNLRKRLRNHFFRNTSFSAKLRRELEAGNLSHILVFVCLTQLDAIVLERYFIQGGYYCGKYNSKYATHSKKNVKNKIRGKGLPFGKKKRRLIG